VKQFAPACERNWRPILDVLREILPQRGRVFEIGSGTGQHIVYFARHLPGLTWQPSDVHTNLSSIEAWRREACLENIEPALALDLYVDDWSIAAVDCVISINTLHIVSWEGVERLIRKASALLPVGGLLYVYGPFRYADWPLEPSNLEFDRWLKRRDPRSGIRDIVAVDRLAQDADLEMEGDRVMPANNRSIWWRKLVRSKKFTDMAP